MKELRGSASENVAADLEVCFALLADAEGYPRWHPSLIGSVHVLGRDGDGRADRVDAVLKVRFGPIDRDLDVRLGVRARPYEEVALERLPGDARDRESLSMRWTLVPAPGAGTRVSLALAAEVDLPRFVPLPGGAGDEVARRFVAAAAVALSA